MAWFSNWFRRSVEDEAAEETVPDAPLTAPASQKARRRSSLPRFRGTAVDKIGSGGRRSDLVRMKLRKAFTPSRPVVEPTMYAGRSDVLRGLISSIEDQQLHVVIFGSRGIGKTSTLHVLCDIAREARYHVRYNSCGERTSFDELFRSILGDTPLLYHENYDPTADEIEEGLSFLDLVGDAPLTVATVSDILTKISGTRLLIVLDEFDRAGDEHFRRSIAELIKNLSDRASRVQLVIAGVAQNLNEIIEHIPSIRRNILGLQLPNMSDAEIRELVANGEAASGMAFSDDTLELICNMVLGLPYLASLISHHAGLVALDADRVEVQFKDVEAALETALGEIDLRMAPSARHQIARAVESRKNSELGLLARIALQNSGRLTHRAVKAAVDTPLAAEEYLQSLKAAFGLIEPIRDDPDGAYSFIDDGVAQYLWLRLMQDAMLPTSRPDAASAQLRQG